MYFKNNISDYKKYKSTHNYYTLKMKEILIINWYY